jgi:uncharacterized membrane protein
VFNFIVLVAALGALSYEMVEDNFVNLIYARIFGWRVLLLAFVVAAAVVVPVTVVFVLVAPVLFRSYLPLLAKVTAALLVGVGIGWLGFSLFGKKEPPEEVRAARERAPRERRSLALATQLMVIEETEIVAILIPLTLAGHSAEAVVAGIVTAAGALTVALTLRQALAKVVEGRFRLLKAISGTALVLLGLVLFFS